MATPALPNISHKNNSKISRCKWVPYLWYKFTNLWYH